MTFIMLSSASAENGAGEVSPSVEQAKHIDDLLGLSPEIKPFNEALWYAFTEILEGDYSQVKAVDLDPDSWYSPESIISIECQVVVDRYLKDQEPEWWEKMVEARGEPKKGFWSDQMVFDYPLEAGEDVGSPCLYSVLEGVIA
jgi:hypothetical protein